MGVTAKFSARRFRAMLLSWYDASHRRLPWRPEGGEHGDPYRVLVSEFMLQQTQVATVLPYFERFMRTFPDLHALAGADEQRVLAAWQGLGYYRRARFLHAAARAVVREHGGELPGELEALRRLPGVGAYTAAALASIVFGARAAVVDGNVARVLSRWAGLREPIDTTQAKRSLSELAQALVDPERPGDFNQAIMELGATVCVKARPRCTACPLRVSCVAHREGITDQLPVKGKAVTAASVSHVTLAVVRRGRVLMRQRGEDGPKAGMWAEMWEMPTVEAGDEPGNWLHAHHGLRAAGFESVMRFDHATTHRRITFTLLRARGVTGRVRRAVWATMAEIDRMPLSNPQRRMVDAIRRGNTS